MGGTTRKNKKSVKKNNLYSIFSEEDYNSNNGFSTLIWGPCAWLFLHSISFNYPVNPTKNDKKNYKNFILNLQNVLPCGMCRKNLKNNFKKFPIKDSDMENRKTFSFYIYNLHECINKMLNKKTKLTYDEVRERYEHFRGRGVSSKVKELGCSESLYGIKSKCVLNIIPAKQKSHTLKINNKCKKKRI